MSAPGQGREEGEGGLCHGDPTKVQEVGAKHLAQLFGSAMIPGGSPPPGKTSELESVPKPPIS